MPTGRITVGRGRPYTDWKHDGTRIHFGAIDKTLRDFSAGVTARAAYGQ